MTEPRAKVVLDSINDRGSRLTTFEVTMHRFVLAEFNTHRTFSRNSASSRAIPATKMLNRVRQNPAFPAVWLSEKPGMGGGTPLEDEALWDAQDLFRDIHEYTTKQVSRYLQLHELVDDRLHKSWINRLLEPFMWHTVVFSTTDAGLDNFFGLRCHPEAQPEMRLAAEAIREAWKASTPKEKPFNNGWRNLWHLPYIDEEELASLTMEDALRISVARCARVSSDHAGDKFDYEKDYRLFHQLTSNDPMHASPLEHVAYPTTGLIRGNFWSWAQLRHMTDVVNDLRDLWIPPEGP